MPTSGDGSAAARRVVVTGLGVAAPTGVGIAEFGAATAEGRSAIRPLPGDRAWPPGLGGRVPRESLKGRFDARLLRTSTMSDATLLGSCAAAEALTDAGVTHEQGRHLRAGVYVGSSICPPAFEKQAKTSLLLAEHDPGTARGWRLDDTRLPQALKSQSAFDFLKALPNMVASHVSIQGHLAGPVGTLLGSDASGLQAVGEAWHLVREGEADQMVAGGAFSPFQEVYLAWLARRGLLARGSGGEAIAPRPYGVGRTGMVPGEGAAFLVIEERERAIARGAKVYGEVTGYASRFAVPGTAAAVDSRVAVFGALARASAPPGVVVLDGVGTPSDDRADAAALAAFFGPEVPPALVLSGATGFLGPAMGPVGAVAALLAAASRSLPPTPGLGAAAADCDAVRGRDAAAPYDPAAPAWACSFSLDGVAAGISFRAA